jgi:ElaB/YqjD/DUF883 family membrane-anchored ribosome-binding protein
MNTRISAINEPFVSWGAVFAGFFLGIAVYLMLSVLGTAIGASVIDPMHTGPFGGFSIGALIWLAIMTLAATIVGGFFAGRTAHTNGELHGLLTWAVTTLVTAYFFTALVGGILGTAFGLVGKATSMAGQNVAKMAPDFANAAKESLEKSGLTFDLKSLQDQLDRLLSRYGANSEDQTQPSNDLSRFFNRIKHKSSLKLNTRDQDALVDIIATRTEKSHQESKRIAEEYMRTYNDALARYDAAKQRIVQKAREAGNETARTTSRVAWWTFIILVLGAAISMLAGRFGLASQPRNLISRQ